VQCDSSCSVATPPDYGAVQTAFSVNVPLSGGLFGATLDEVVGGPCGAGFTRLSNSGAAVSGTGNCIVRGFNTSDPHDCSISVHVGTAAFQGVTCGFTVTQQRGCN
jgi:hypothetical protein